MRFFTKPAATMSDDELSAVADEETARAEALAEHARRVELKAQAVEEAERQKAEAERRRQVAVLLPGHARHAAEARRAHDALAVAVLAAGEAVRQRAAAQAAAWAIGEQLVQLGEPSPLLALADFPREALRAGIALSPILSREFTDRFNPRGGR